MIQSGSVRQSDLHLLTIEQAANDELRIAALQSYHTHLMDLNILCGIKDTAKVDLEHIDLQPDPIVRYAFFVLGTISAG